MSRDPLYVPHRLLGDASRMLIVDRPVEALNMLTRACGLLADYIAGQGVEAAVLTTGEPVDRFVRPFRYVEPRPCPQAFSAALRGAKCWASPVSSDDQSWEYAADSTRGERERGWHRYECADCGATCEVDSSG